MTSTMDFETAATVVAAAEPGEAVELVRGNEQELLARLAPVVRRESVCLDLASVSRIDAAGLATLITLYSDAVKAGHRFAVTRPGRHVRELLALVGLDRILLASESDGPHFHARFEENAA
jgi:anti-anti-sigma factor